MKANIQNIISKLFINYSLNDLIINYKKKIYDYDFYIFPETE
jgi:hypothetical protein